MASEWRFQPRVIPNSVFVANLGKTGGKLKQPVRFTNDSWNNWPRAWSPDSETLFYISSQSRGIYRRRISSDAAELFAGGSEDIRRPA